MTGERACARGGKRYRWRMRILMLFVWGVIGAACVVTGLVMGACASRVIVDDAGDVATDAGAPACSVTIDGGCGSCEGLQEVPCKDAVTGPGWCGMPNWPDDLTYTCQACMTFSCDGVAGCALSGDTCIYGGDGERGCPVGCCSTCPL